MEKRDYADFRKWGEALHCSPFLARLLRNRVTTIEEAKAFLYASPEDLGDAHLIRDMDKAVGLIARTVREDSGKIAVAADYDCDGIFSGQILKEGLERLGASVKLYTPNRVKEGYGLNEEIVDKAAAWGGTPYPDLRQRHHGDRRDRLCPQEGPLNRRDRSP